MEKKINDTKGMIILVGVIIILFFWTVIGLIVGVFLLVRYDERKEKFKNELIEVDYKLSKLK